MSIKYIQQIKSGEWKITSSKSGKTLRLMDSKKEAIMYVSAIKATTSIFVKNDSGWVETLSNDSKTVKVKKETPKTPPKEPAVKKVVAKKATIIKPAIKDATTKKTTTKSPTENIVTNKAVAEPVVKKPTEKDDMKKTEKFNDSVLLAKEQAKTSVVAKIFILLFLVAVIAGIFVSAWFLVE